MLPGPRSLLAAVRDPADSAAAIDAVVPELAGCRYMLLSTVKRDGTSVATPVWFAVANGRLVATSESTAWKVKRLHNNPHATVAPCDVRGQPDGPPVPVVGELLGAADEPAARAALSRRYGVAFDAIGLLARIRHRGRAPRRTFMGFHPAI